VGTIIVRVIPILSISKRSKHSKPRIKQQKLREIGNISEEVVKGDVRSHAIK
jgi:hypothetical protein